ncbi:MAG: rod shape-determining protein MreC [Lachnospiraceae bacterium]|nr:rod shape-determining protein MreC [Lachnospiraceae bacterium]MDD7326719.1 rod shape-determining protein MreC [Lachnospiraceae bacterium]MDY2758877.1 rod shape-determining protein MreC [Lachnospiraceae bacterium]
MNKKDRINIPGYVVLLFLGLLCIVILFFSYATGFTGGPLQSVADYVFAPMQQGLTAAGSGISHTVEEHTEKKKLLEENKRLEARVTELESRLTNTQLRENELDRLQELLDLSKDYDKYKTTGARIIAKGTSNWFSTFTINKGSADGIKRDMNVIADNGLVGVVVSTGKHYANVRSIIDDDSNVSAQVADTEDQLIVSGSLEGMQQSGMITFSGLRDEKNQVKSGDAVVTSNISSKYLPGILIGYIGDIDDSSDDLTKSGTITPVADFTHLSEVLVITQLKESGS